MNRADPGLRVIIGSWLATYRKAIASSGLTKQALRRLDPSPRLELLRQEGMLPSDDAEARALIDDFKQAVEGAPI